tara:strand:+ start:203 stop:808 length:606 start_codon:yes stop_codon:yes gene_type:complete
MKTKILTNEDNRARVALLDEAGNPAHELELILCEGRGKDTEGKACKFLYWAFEAGKESNLDLSDFQDWLGALSKAGLLSADPEMWQRDAIGYRLNNGKFKTLQRTSKDGQRLDNLTPQEKLEAIVKSLGDGSAFKVRSSGDSKAKVEAKLAASEGKGKRMAEIFTQCRKLEADAKSAKGKALETINAEIAKLDQEFAALNA